MATLIDSFTGPYAFLDMRYPVKVEWEGAVYPTGYHAYQAGRVLDPDLRRQIAGARTAGLARERAVGAVQRPSWDMAVRYQVMREVLEVKFSGFYLRRLLVSTGEAELVRGNGEHDTHWGRCVCPRHHGFGVNWLGLMLEGLRMNLREYA
jgi:predicted NAD-dependent protein-ADP-ribosyltransferase YbiA (DUF1768 family)